MENNSIFPKTPTGVNGLDEITHGGFPKGRPILICGSPGCGKTLFGLQFLVNGITEYNEPGVFMSFEETAEDLSQNVQSLGFDLEKLKAENKLKVDYVHIDKSEIEETGEYDLEGIFIRLNYAIESIGAKRVVLDTIESVFGGMQNMGVLRSEIRRLFHWLKQKGVTTIITGEKGETTITRQGLEEYVSDCVILLDFRVIEQIATRRLRIIKYRGSTHGTNEYPFLIDDNGITVMPVTSLKLEYNSPQEIITSGLPEMDRMFFGEGIYRGNSILVTGTAGTAKTILATHFAASSCERGEPVLYFSFEESPGQLLRNMSAVGINLQKYIDENLLTIYAARPSLQGLERHLLNIYRSLKIVNPKTIIIDPISSLLTIGSNSEVRSMLVRLLDMFKNKEITALFTSLTHNSKNHQDATVDAVSSLADTWIHLENESNNGHFVRKLHIIKSRGMGHENNPRSFEITDGGIKLHMKKNDELVN